MTRELQVGDRIADNDPRMVSRVLTVTTMNDRYVFAVSAHGRESRIRLKSVYTDSKPRRTGYSLVADSTGEASA